jgi:hypothetical protein
MGRDEELVISTIGVGEETSFCGGECGFWIVGWGDCSRIYDAVGCVEDEVDVGEREDTGHADAEQDLKRVWTTSILLGDWATSYVDIDWWCCVLG